jgi:hypothetical protein
VAQYLKCLGPQVDVVSALAEAPAPEIEREAVEPQNCLSGSIHLSLRHVGTVVHRKTLGEKSAIRHSFTGIPARHSPIDIRRVAT